MEMPPTTKTRPQRLARLLRCPTCGVLRVFVVTGAVCPQGHGGIVPCDEMTYTAAAAIAAPQRRKVDRCL
jgi:hypothetical protein